MRSGFGNFASHFSVDSVLRVLSFLPRPALHKWDRKNMNMLPTPPNGVFGWGKSPTSAEPIAGQMHGKFLGEPTR